MVTWITVILGLVVLVNANNKSEVNFLIEIRNQNGISKQGNYKKCTGTRVSANWLLTAASCVSKTDNIRKITLYEDSYKNLVVKQVEIFPGTKVHLQLINLKNDERFLETLEVYEPNLTLLKFGPTDTKQQYINSFVNGYFPNATKKSLEVSLETLGGDGIERSFDVSLIDCDPVDVKFVCARPKFQSRSQYPTYRHVGGPLITKKMELVGILSTSFIQGWIYDPIPPIIFTNIDYLEYKKWILSWIHQ